MKTKILAFAAMGVLALSTTSTQAGGTYEYTYETDATTNSGSGSAVATENGSVTITPGGAVGNFGDFDGGDAPGGDSVDLNIAGDAIAIGNVEISLQINMAGIISSWNDWISFTTSGGNNFFIENGGNGSVRLFELGGNAEIVTGTTLVNDTAWHLVELKGTTSGADAMWELFVDGTTQGTSTVVGGAGDTLQDVRIGGRVGADNRYIDAGIDEVKIIPEPASLALLGLGGLMMIRRRRA